jgi:hypothetical protein
MGHKARIVGTDYRTFEWFAKELWSLEKYHL